MDVNNESCTPAVNGNKKKRKITLEDKLEVLKRFTEGQRGVDIARALGLPPTTVRTIRGNAEKIITYAKMVSPSAAKKLTRNRSGIMVTMERLLKVWIENQHDSPCSFESIQAKALSLFEELKQQKGDSAEDEVFVANQAWFDRFKTRSKLHNIHFMGEDEPPNADEDAAAAYPTVLKKIIEDGGYMPQQVFNVGETGLFWKRLTAKTNMSQEEKYAFAFDAIKDRITILLGGNAAGDLKLKPLLVYHDETPRSMEGYSKAHLPVVWRSNKRGSLSRTVFEEWFAGYFCPTVKEYCRLNELEHKALLILDNTPGHPPNLDDLSDNVQVIFLPQNTASLIQPMNQGVISTFKAYYLRHTFEQLIKFLYNESKPAVREFLRAQHIMKAIDNLSDAWQDVETSTMNRVWSRLWPECIDDFLGYEQPISEVHEKIVGLSQQAGLNEVEVEDVVELLESHGGELSNDDVMQIEQSKEEDDTLLSRSLSTKDLGEAFEHLEMAMVIFTEKDPQRERSSQANRIITSGYKCYRELFEQKKKNERLQTLDVLFQHPTEHQYQKEVPTASPTATLSDHEAIYHPVCEMDTHLPSASLIATNDDGHASPLLLSFLKKEPSSPARTKNGELDVGPH